ncbi:peptidase S8/S53 domain-containing protein [Hyaloraphidium curvatum]|nr:peptidase S8/S53 domain-containing protein [Hyaloraphidium curvatum]
MAPRTALAIGVALCALAVSAAAAPPLRFHPRDESKPFLRRQGPNVTVAEGSYVIVYNYPQNVDDYFKTWATTPAPLVANPADLEKLYWPQTPPSYETWKNDSIKWIAKREEEKKLQNCTFLYTGPLLHSATCQVYPGSDWNATLTELKANTATFDFVEPNINLATPPNNGSVTPSDNPWICIKDVSPQGAGEYAPVHVDIDGEVACMANATRGACLWRPTNASCVQLISSPPDPIVEIQCGADHEAIFGFTGYDEPSSWCNSLNRTTNGTADGRPTGLRFVDRLLRRQSPRTQQTPVRQNWDIDRINQRNLPLDQSYDYLSTAGQGVTVYVIDTGIRITHSEFEGTRARWGITTCKSKGCPDIDDQGHGTFVAGLVAGKMLGVAKKSEVVAIKALNSQGSGTNSDIIAGIQWALDDFKRRGGKPSVINMSLGGGRSEALNRAVLSAIAMGVHVVTAAGNEDQDACGVSPASASPGTAVLTVGSTNKRDGLSSFSNWGTCVDILAPGEEVVSASHKGDTQATQNSGTSFSCPTVAGAMALLLGNNPNAGLAITPQQLKSAILADTTPNVISIPSGSRRSTPNKLLYTGAQQGSPDTTTRPPSSNFNQPPPEQVTTTTTTSSSGLSTAAIIGIVVGVVLVIGLIAWFCIAQKRKKDKAAKAAAAQAAAYQQPPVDVKTQPAMQTVPPAQYQTPGYAAPAVAAPAATVYQQPAYAPPPAGQPANLYSAPSYADGSPVGADWQSTVPPATPPK